MARDVNKLGTYHISSDIQNYETARSNDFALIVEDLDDLLYPQFSYTGDNAANQYVTGTTPTPTYVFGGTDRPDQQNLTDNMVRDIVNKGFNVTQLMQKYNGTNPKIPRCYLS